jgi:tetratricopeptide (TPR) repeat protein
MGRWLAALLLVGAVLGPLAARADDWSDCLQKDDFDRRVRACTNILASGGRNTGERATAFNNRGWVLSQREEYDRAIADFDAAAEIWPWPDDPAIYHNRGISLLYNGAFDRAIADFSKVMLIEPNNGDAFFMRAYAYRGAGNLEKALADMQKALPLLSPNDGLRRDGLELIAELELQLGREAAEAAPASDVGDCLLARDPAALLVACTRIIEGPSDRDSRDLASAHNSRGYFHLTHGNLDAAMADFDKAIEIKPEAHVHANRGIAFVEKGDPVRAMADYDAAIRLDPNLDYAYYLRGNLHLDRGELDLAVADYGNAIRIRPDEAAYSNRGNAYFEKGELDLAIADYDSALELSPSNPTVYLNRGVAYGAKGDFSRALADATLAVGFDPDNAQGYYLRGATYEELGDPAKALADLREAMRLSPAGDPSHAKAAALIAEIEGKPGEAAPPAGPSREDFAACDFSPDSDLAIKACTNIIGSGSDADDIVVAYNYRAAAYLQKGDFALAIADFDKALAAVAADAQGHFFRGLAYHAKGDTTAALEDLHEAVRLFEADEPMRKSALEQIADIEGGKPFTFPWERGP